MLTMKDERDNLNDTFGFSSNPAVTVATLSSTIDSDRDSGYAIELNSLDATISGTNSHLLNHKTF